jgi:hypothetical protein
MRGSWQNMAVFADDISVVFAQFGDANSGEVSHSVICEAVSACRALRRLLRSIPGRVPHASIRSRCASTDNRSAL